VSAEPANPGQARAIVRELGRVDYLPTIKAMQAFTEGREAQTPDELWLCEHSPVFTQGVAGEASHVLNPGSIPVVSTNRGGQVTYHGPGQVVAYPLINLKRLGIFVKEYVYRLEHCVLKTLEFVGVTGHRVPGAPGIYVRLDDPFSHAPLEAAEPRQRQGIQGGDLSAFRGLGKIAALGIKVSRHCTYHGLALNVAMDLAPFSLINPCGYSGLQTVDLATLGIQIHPAEAAQCLAEKLVSHLSP
jgi:lipoyl(octanoyl) transferase